MLNNKKLSRMLAILLVFIISIQVTYALNDIYTGDIHIHSISAFIDIQENATVNIEYVLINKVNETRQVNLGFNQDNAFVSLNGGAVSNPVIFQPGENVSINVTYSDVVLGNNLKSYSFRPTTVFFNGKYHAKQTKLYDIKVKLPENVNKLLRSNKEFTSMATESGRTIYYWHFEHQYPTTLFLKWNTLDFDLSINKNTTHITEFNETINVTVKIQNNGVTDAINITLFDAYPTGLFEPVSPLGEFIVYGPPIVNDSGYVQWMRNIAVLGPGEIQEIIYSLRPQHMKDILLKPTTAIVNSTTVAISNRITIENKLCGNDLCDPNENYLSCLADCPLTDDYDEDGINNSLDNCPLYPNPNQNDTDSDGLGNICDPLPDDGNNDEDDDGYDIFTTGDNCPTISNPDQLDNDSDGHGDACDVCPSDTNPEQLDSDSDGHGDICDVCPFDSQDDNDSDGICADIDNCPNIPNLDQTDQDGDGLGVVCDNCYLTFNPDQTDSNGDGIGDACESESIINITLNQGWNLISIPLILEDNSVEDVFSSIDYSDIFSYDFTWEIPTEIDNTMGLWVKMDNSDTLTVEGLEPENTPINLNTAWNLIGYRYLEEKDISELYNNATVFAYNNSKWYSYNPDKPSNTLTKFTPGYGYWINKK